MLFQQSVFIDRDNLPEFFTESGLTNVGVEIGTHKAEFASTILEKCKDLNLLICVDPWLIPEGYEEQAKTLGQGTREEHYLEAKERLSKFSRRHKIIRGTSETAAINIPDNSVDFVYIDGDHSEEGMYFDLKTWWSKIRKGGVICGHDVICPGEVNGGWGFGIQKALRRWEADFIKEDLVCYLIAESKCLPWSFYIKKEQ